VTARRRVLLLNENLGFGGGEVHTAHLARSLRALDWDAVLVVRPQAWLNQPENEDLPRRHAPYANEVDPVTIYRLIRLAAGATVVHAHASRDHVLGTLAARMAGVPIVRTLHNFLESSLSKWARRQMARAARLVCVSQALKDHLPEYGLPLDRAVVIPNGIDTERFAPGDPREARDGLGLPGDATIVGAVGNLIPVKGYELLLEAMRDVPDALLALGGDGPERQRLESLARDLGLQDRVRFLGHQADPRALYRAADVFAMSSRMEAFPLVALEAQSCAKPVVAFAVGGIPEAVEDGRSGRLAPPEDPAALARAIRDVLADPRAMGEAARARIERSFSLRRMAVRISELYEEVAG